MGRPSTGRRTELAPARAPTAARGRGRLRRLLPRRAARRVACGSPRNLEAMGPDHQPLELAFDANGFPSYGYEGLGGDPRVHHRLPRPSGRRPATDVGPDGQRAPAGDRLRVLPWGGQRARQRAADGGLPLARPDAARCGACHNASFDHNLYHPEADHIVEDYRGSLHSASINAHVYAEGSTTDVQALCSKCHTDEGAKRYRGVSGGLDALEAALPDTLPAVAGATPVQCRTCHDRHDPGKLLLEGTNSASAEYRTCTACHQTADSFHGERRRLCVVGIRRRRGSLRRRPGDLRHAPRRSGHPGLHRGVCRRSEGRPCVPGMPQRALRRPHDPEAVGAVGARGRPPRGESGRRRDRGRRGRAHRRSRRQQSRRLDALRLGSHLQKGPRQGPRRLPALPHGHGPEELPHGPGIAERPECGQQRPL